ncbi:MAG: efflux RND transporter permease subunit, partial [Alphaproteobacteria bacterium]|nr:efflux RND transporter permease subunit [Alphaproteobacteria bacterium]
LRCAKTKPKNKKADMAWFKRIFDYQMAHPWRVVGLSFVALVLTVIPMRWVGSEFAPNTDMNEITIVARGPAGTSFAKSEQIAEDIEQRLAEFREVEFTSVKIGDRGTQNIDIQVGLIPRAQRISDRRLVQKMLPVLADIPGAEIQIAAGAQMPGMMGDLVMNIYGPRDELRDAYADEIMRRLNRIPEIQSAVLAAQLPGDELKFIPDPEKMKYWGVQNQTAAFALRSALFGHDSFRYREDGHEFPIIIEFGPEYKSRAMFDSVFVPTMKGLVALSELGTVETAPATSEIRRVDRARVTEIGIILGKSTIGPVRSQIIADLSDMDFAAGYGIRFAGMAEMQDETSGEMMAAFLLATILTYILLAAIMNSLAHPLTVATTILFSFAGVFVFLFLTGASMNIAAMLAIVMLVGLSLNNNIIVLEPAIMRIAAGEGAEKALWTEFVDKRRMLYMTTIAVVAGMVPQLWSADGMKISMGAVIVGGMLASLFWTFAMTPAVFMLMERVRPKKSDEACKLPREKVSV